LRDIRKQLFDAPLKINTEPQKVVVNKIQSNDQALNKKDNTKISDENNNMSSVTSQPQTHRRTRRTEQAKNDENNNKRHTISFDSRKSVGITMSANIGEPNKTEPKKTFEVKTTENRKSMGVTLTSTAEPKKIESKFESKKTFETKTNGTVDKPKAEFKPNDTGLRRTATWATNRSNNNTNAFAANKAKFGTQSASDRPKSSMFGEQKNAEPGSGRTTPSNRASTNSRPQSWINKDRSSSTRTGSNRPGSFKPEVEAPSFNSGNKSMSAADRMAAFREAEENLKKDEEKRKAKEAERKRLAEEAAAREKAAAEEKKKKEEEEKKKAEEEAAKKTSDKMPAPCEKKKREKKKVRRTMSISNIVMDWVQEMTKEYPVEITNFSTSWNNGMAFCALIHHFNPDEFDFNELKPENKRHNFDLAFNTGLKCKDIPILLDTEDMVRMKKPEPRSVQTYIQWIWSVYGPTSGYGPTHAEIQQAQIS